MQLTVKSAAGDGVHCLAFVEAGLMLQLSDPGADSLTMAGVHCLASIGTGLMLQLTDPGSDSPLTPEAPDWAAAASDGVSMSACGANRLTVRKVSVRVGAKPCGLS